MASQTSIALLFLAASFVAAQAPEPTRMLTEPALSATHLAFVHDSDLWIADRDDPSPRRLTTHKGVEGRPRFSPDGRLVAFHAEYDGNLDVYVVAVDGGEPRRLTWHPGADLVQGFTVDGASVLFTSQRAVHTRRFRQLWTVPIAGGPPVRLPIPNADKASFAPDGRRIAYTPLGEAFRQWKNYRGGRVSRIWIYDLEGQEVIQVPQPDGRCNDTEPMWVGERLHFLTDRFGEFEIASWAPGDDAVRRHTTDEAFPVLEASTDGRQVIFERRGWLHLLDPATDTVRRLALQVRSDRIETRPRHVSGSNWIRNADLSPSGRRAIFEFRGEIVTVPRKTGDPRNLTRTPGVHERSPVWSPDGEHIAWFSDAGGEYRLHVAGESGRAEPRSYELGGAGFYDRPAWSPDGKRIAFTDNAFTLRWIDLESGEVRLVSEEPIYGPRKIIDFSWSPDSRWIAHTRSTRSLTNQIFLHEIASGASRPLTDGLADARHPVFDASGRYLWFVGSTDAGPVRAWFAMSNADMQLTQSLYLAVLDRGVASPLAARSDEEGEDDVRIAALEDDASVSIAFEGLDQRILSVPTGRARFAELRADGPGRLLYLRTGDDGSTSLRRFDLKDRKAVTIASNVSRIHVSAGGDHALVRAGQRWSIIKPKEGASLASGRLDTDAISVRIDPRAEWRQIFEETWRINRDYFYDPGMHGADWDAMREKYSTFLPHLATRSDLNRVLQWMCSELAVGHHRVNGGDRLHRPDRVGGGLLGADIGVDSGRYRVERVYHGENFNPGLRSPLTEPGVDVVAGSYLLAVDGRPIAPPENLHARFENTAGKQVRITVASSPDGADARTVTVVPIGNEANLRNRAWIEGNLRRVHEATDGRVAYVYVPNTAGAGHASFKRYFFPQADREAVIVDERYNSGGQIADYVIDILRREETSWWATRYGADFKAPLISIQGPKVMLIDETAGSGGDLLPWMFSKFGLGKLIGRPTWGGLVGILGFPTLMDGGRVTAPNVAIWTEDGFIVENVGVPPDIEVEQWPAAVEAGRDPQLERAIQEIMKELPPEPQPAPRRPPFPRRAR